MEGLGEETGLAVGAGAGAGAGELDEVGADGSCAGLGV